MKKLKILSLTFDNSLDESKLRAFRSAIANKVNREKIVFHHHITNDKVLHRYPLIQYKLINNRLSIVSFNEATDEILHFLSKGDLNVKIYNEELNLEVYKINLNQVTLNVWNNFFSYRINNWLALNDKNYKKYNKIESLCERVAFLEKILISHIISFAEGVKWNIDKEIKLIITNLHKQRLIKYKNVNLMAFDISFTTNVSLPNYVGLGKAARLGYGTVVSTKKEDSMLENKMQKEIDAVVNN